jgi:hypothetical protein
MFSRIDLIFSYWIFFWFLLFILFRSVFKIISPAPILFMGLIGNVIILLLMIYNQTNIYMIGTLGLFILFSKIFPLYLIRDVAFQKLTYKQVSSTILVTIVFCVYFVFITGSIENSIELIDTTVKDLINGRSFDPILGLVSI